MTAAIGRADYPGIEDARQAMDEPSREALYFDA
jgi:hypothetical protein